MRRTTRHIGHNDDEILEDSFSNVIFLIQQSQAVA